MSDITDKNETKAQTVVNGASDDTKTVEQIANDGNAAAELKTQKKKKPNNKSKRPQNVTTPNADTTHNNI